MDEETIKLSTMQPYDWDTDEVSWREILKFVSEELNKDNYFYIIADDENIYLKWRTDGRVFATVYTEKVIEIIKYIKEEHRR